MFFFTLQTEDDTAVSPHTPPTASILLDDETLYPAQVDKPPYYVALVLDASGSMEDVFPEAQQAALDLVDAAPVEVEFAVIRFDEQFDVIQGFTGAHTRVANAINGLEVANKGTCLYDAAYTAVQSLNQIAPNNPRRAIIVFSDGRDQIVQASTDPCSRRTYEQAQTFATSQGLPIYTVGITGDNTEPTIVTLSQLAENASSFSESDPFEYPDDIVNRINSQWVAHANVQPTAGLQRGALLLDLASGEPLLPAPVQFFSERDYSIEPPPPLPLSIDIVNFRYDERLDTFQFDLFLTNFPPNHILHVETKDSVNGNQVDLTTATNFSNSQQIIINTDEFEPNGRYTTIVSARDNTGRFLKNDQGETLMATYDFRYNPPLPLQFAIDSIIVEDEPAKLNLRQFRLEDDQPELIVALQLENTDAVTEYNGRYINLRNNEASDPFTFDIIRKGNTATARIPATFVDTTYTLVLNALNENGEQLATTSDQFSYATPDGIFVRAAKAVGANPILWLALLLLLAIVAFVAGRIGRAIGESQAKPVVAAPVTTPQTASEQQPATLTMISSPDENLTAVGRWELEQLPFLIGREGCDLTISGDQHVSRKHARISFTDDNYFIEDLGSSNGTFINANQIAAHQPLLINAERGERIRIGKTTSFVFGELTAEQINELTNSNGSNHDNS